MSLSDDMQQYIDDNSVTYDQARNISYSQLVSLFGPHSKTTFIVTLRPILASMRRQLNIAKLQAFKGYALTWCQNNIDPACEIDVKHRPLHFEVWPEGIPEAVT